MLYSRAIRGDQKRHGPAQYLFCVFQIITFCVDHSFYACEQSPKELTASKELKAMHVASVWIRRTKSRKERNYAPRLANSWLRHWYYVCGWSVDHKPWTTNSMPPLDDDHNILPTRKSLYVLCRNRASVGIASASHDPMLQAMWQIFNVVEPRWSSHIYFQHNTIEIP